MKFDKKELEVLAEIVRMNVATESNEYGENTEIYKESESYKVKSKLYEKLMSEWAGHEMKINEESIFGLLDIK